MIFLYPKAFAYYARKFSLCSMPFYLEMFDQQTRSVVTMYTLSLSTSQQPPAVDTCMLCVPICSNMQTFTLSQTVWQPDTKEK